MFKKILIANRGEIAVRIARTLKKMGVTSVAVYSDADHDSLHVSVADEAVALNSGGSSSAAETYLRGDRILEIARKTGAGAVIPGYGFLSENTTFAEQCAEAGVVFVGPTPEQVRRFGLKHTARDRRGRWRAADTWHRPAAKSGRCESRCTAHRVSRHAQEHGRRRWHRSVALR
ncbi:biotin carboxylase N-terminal domain-containing protein [Xanthomonas axonopodis pv. fascicularis]|uniref:biotin carboxylase N-terminal domain-containing protein n=1 Tax=Xanthomonas axonopodis TaxID=53413 RepID=UPI003530F546